MKRIVATLYVFFCLSALFAVEPPYLRCISVEDDGQVTLTWLSSGNMTDFVRYEVFFSSDNQNFTLIDQISNPQTTTYTHTTADALNNAQLFYYVAACSSSSCVNSDTLSTLALYLSNLGNGLATLNWTPPVTPLLDSYESQYEIFREYPSSVWSLIATTSQAVFRDTIDICDADLGYRVELADHSGCRNVSRHLNDQFSDTYGPEIPTLDSVSVDFYTSQIVLGWEPSASPDAFAYIVYHLENNLWVPTDTIFGRQTTTWTDFLSSPDIPQQYRVATLDSCMNSSPMCEPQHHIRANATYDLCRREAVLTWEAYEGMPFDVDHYDVFYSENGGPLLFAGSASANNRSFTLTDLVPQSTYDCIARAVNGNGTITASTLKFSFLFNSADNNDFAYIRYVSVLSKDKIEIKVTTGPTVAFSKVHLYRSVGNDQEFVHLMELQNDGTDTYIFEDEGVRTDRTLYYYRATVENECQVETYQSNISHNILLTGDRDSESRRNYLDWNSYEGWDGGVGGYTVYRKCESDLDFLQEQSSMSANSYSDDVTNLRRDGEKFLYYVEAEETYDSYGYMEKSVSNVIELKQRPQTYIPNAFCPRVGGINSVFLPVNSYVTMENYHMYIYSREGVLLFHSTDPQVGWNGGYNGNLMPTGAYIYKITYTYGVDEEFEAVGTVTLVR